MSEIMDSFYEGLVDNADLTSARLLQAEGEEAGALAKTLDMQAKTIIAYQQHVDEAELNRDKLALERYRIDEELRLKKDIEETRIAIERSKSNAEKASLWCKVGIETLSLGSTIAMGILYLKANMKYGGMIGKDAQNWFKDLKHIKL